MGDLMGEVGQLAAMADHFDKIQKLKVKPLDMQ